MRQSKYKSWDAQFMEALQPRQIESENESDGTGSESVSEYDDVSDLDLGSIASYESPEDNVLPEARPKAVVEARPKAVVEARPKAVVDSSTVTTVVDPSIVDPENLRRLVMSQTDDPLLDDLIFLESLVNETYPERIKALQTLRNTIRSASASPYFDDEDMKWVEDDIKDQFEELKRLQTIWKQTSSVYQNTLLKLATTIQARQQILSHVDGQTNIFTHRPKLVENFAKKQADLSELMETCKDSIRKEQKAIRDQLARETEDQFAILDSDDLEFEQLTMDDLSLNPSKSTTKPVKKSSKSSKRKISHK